MGSCVCPQLSPLLSLPESRHPFPSQVFAAGYSLLMRQGLRWFQSFGAGVGVRNGSVVFFGWLSWLLGWVNWLVGGLVNWLVSWLGLVGLLVGLVD